MAKTNVNNASVTRHIDNFLQRVEAAIIRRLEVLGEQCVNVARSVNSYKDQTGNLRNSIGYVILKNGVIIRRDFKKSASVTTVTKSGKSKTNKGSADGVAVGEAYAELLAKKFPEGYVLIVVAGMSYAGTLESRSIDVLTTAEQYAEQKLPGMIAQLKANINNAKL